MLSQVQLLKKYKIRVRGHLGQHLLMDPNTIRKIVDGLLLENGEPVFEIGPGLGAVTTEILKRGHPVLAVEKDPKFVEILQNEIGPEFPGKLEVIRQDILECDLGQLFADRKFNAQVKVIGNLPYYISTPILFYLIDRRELFRLAVFMLQKEVAARMTAKAGEEDYGRLSVSSAIFGETEALFDVSPKCFLPAPEVTSRVVRYTFREELRIQQEKFLLELVRIAFSQRRKTLLSLLLKNLKPKRDRTELEDIFQALGFLPTVRGEDLTRDDFIAFTDKLA